MNNDKDIRSLNIIKEDADNVQIPDSLSPDNMMKKIAKMKEEGAFKESKEVNIGKKNNKKKNKRKLMALISGGMATVVAAASLGIILLGPGSRNVVSDRLVFKDIYNNIANNNFEDNKVETLASYEDLAKYYMAQSTMRKKETLGDKIEDFFDDFFVKNEVEFAPENDDLDSNYGGSFDGVTNENNGGYFEESKKPGSDNENSETTPDYSETNTRTENVGEADIVKTDGKYIYYLSSKLDRSNDKKVDLVLSVVRADGDKTVEIFEGSISEPILNTVSIESNKESKTYFSDKEMLVYEDKLVVVCSYGGCTVLSFYNIQDKTKPELINTLFMEGIYDSCRFVDGHLYVFSEKSIGMRYGYGYDDIYIERYEKEDIEDLSIDQLKGRLAVCTSEGELNPDDIYVANCEKFELYHMIGTVDMTDTSDFKQVKAVLGQSSGTVYVSAKNIYYVDSVYRNKIEANVGEEVEDGTKSEIIKLSYSEGKVVPVGRTIVDGSVGDEFAIDEYNGYLRIAVSVNRWKGKCESVDMEYYNGSKWVTDSVMRIHPYTYSDYRTVSALYVLDENLEVVGSIPELKKNERVYGVRFDGDIAYVVTYRQMDPLFTIDLSDPTNPTVIGALKIPGFSTYLHKWDDNKLIGIGHDDGWNIKISTFDITDKTDVKETDVFVLEDAYHSEALYNHKAIFISPKNNLLGFGDQDGCYRIFSYVNGNLVEKIRVQMDDNFLSDTRALYIGEYIYVVGENNGVFVYRMSDFKKVAEVE